MFGELRKKRAAERLVVSSNRTPEEQLKRLDTMFGVGQGARKEREKLAKKIRDRDTKTDVPKEEKAE
jgi:hypothetical protein